VIIGPCTVFTGGAEPAVIEEAAVRVVGGHIAQLGPAGNLASGHPDETLWPARGRVLMPGFVNTHAHLARHLARGLGLRHPEEWKRYERALSWEDVRAGVRAALVEGVRHGITTVCDFHRSGSWLDASLRAVVDAARNVGVRVATCRGAAEDDTAYERRFAAEESRELAGELEKQREGKLRGMVGVQASTLGGIELLIGDAFEVAGDRMALHVDLALDLTPAERWRGRRAWRETALPSLWAHAETAPRELVAAARERGDVISAAGLGSPATLAREADLAWGTDAGVNALPVPHATSAWLFDARQYRTLFVNGPRWAARHFGCGLGEIAPGAPADLLLADYRPATELSSRTLMEHLGAGLLRAPVSGVMVSGEILMDNGVLVSADEREVAARGRECAKRVWGRLG